ncbi:Ankyrin repeat domain containing protein [Pandoravirus salinus]|uniref:Ankyrin repeat domain containing protein n=1 Tax=Pandoravirus salinus TaxID=1349410 RepID=S4W2R0_9VIRU|nr:ankyrin repeat domain [Pandoravirus salinus]AGO84480.1 Ankyrin repeat domain containing protein [Pandoravirus salinus]
MFDDLPPEVVCRIMGMLSNKDLVAARLVHRCFSVQESERVMVARKHALWLRTSPERACKAKRADVLAYLYARKRVPRTINLDAAAVDSGDIDVVRVVRQHSASWNDRKALVGALANADARFFWLLLDEVAPKVDNIGWLLPHAVEVRRDDVMGRILDDKPATWDVGYALRRAAACGNLSATKTLLRAPGVGSLVDALRTACMCDNLEIVQLLIEHDPGLRGALVSACDMRASPNVLGFLLRCDKTSDMRHMLDKPGLSIEVARLLHDAYPDHSLQCLLDNAMSADMARFACNADPHLDLQRGLDTAVQASRIDIVRFVYARRTTLCLEPGLKHAALHGRWGMFEALCEIDRGADLVRYASTLAHHYLAPVPLLACIDNLCSALSAQATIVQHGWL